MTQIRRRVFRWAAASATTLLVLVLPAATRPDGSVSRSDSSGILGVANPGTADGATAGLSGAGLPPLEAGSGPPPVDQVVGVPQFGDATGLPPEGPSPPPDLSASATALPEVDPPLSEPGTPTPGGIDPEPVLTPPDLTSEPGAPPQSEPAGQTSTPEQPGGVAIPAGPNQAVPRFTTVPDFEAPGSVVDAIPDRAPAQGSAPRLTAEPVPSAPPTGSTSAAPVPDEALEFDPAIGGMLVLIGLSALVMALAGLIALGWRRRQW